ncbi:hypothetical protein MANI_113561 [Metarhizium anisopliae]|uniref:Cyanovirin-N domain-containing protein n=3 Tax=Metarhizium TaxID=5529 RepID=A0A0D9P9Y1_METAN
MVNFISLAVLAMASVAVAAPPPPNGSVWWHTCGNCKCGHSGAYENFKGDTGCLRFDPNQDIRAAGLTRHGRLQTTCSLFTSDNCSGKVAQSIGVASGTYACTAFNQNTKSIRCYYDV